LQHQYHVDRVISTVDAVNGELHLDRNPESTRQVAAADVIVLTKTDIAKTDAIHTLRARLRSINPSARVIEAPLGEVDPEELFSLAANWSSASSHGGPDLAANGSGPVPETPDAGDARHVSHTHSTALTFDRPVDWTAFGIWFSMLLHARGEDVLRVKGLVDVGETGPVLLNGVQHVVHPPEHLGEWPDDDRRSRIVFITRGIRSEELTTSLEAFRGVVGAGPLLLEADAPV
jgi:G3E family GTPase